MSISLLLKLSRPRALPFPVISSSFSNMETHHQPQINYQLPRRPAFTRETLRKHISDPDLSIQRRMEAEEASRRLNSQILSLPSNDQNPANILKIKIRNTSGQKQTENAVEKIQGQLMRVGPAKVSSELLIEKIASRKKKEVVEALRKKVFSKRKKLIVPMGAIKAMHLFDAMALLSASQTRAAKYVLIALKMARNNAINKGWEETRLYIESAITGRESRRVKLRYHGKGGTGRIKNDTCQIRIRLYEKSIEDMYKLMIIGKTPAMIAYHMRQSLVEGEAGLEDVRRLNGVLTAKGRQQRRLMFKRKVMIAYLENLVSHYFIIY